MSLRTLYAVSIVILVTLPLSLLRGGSPYGSPVDQNVVVQEWGDVGCVAEREVSDGTADRSTDDPRERGAFERTGPAKAFYLATPDDKPILAAVVASTRRGWRMNVAPTVAAPRTPIPPLRRIPTPLRI